MAAPAVDMAGASEDSSSDDEQLKRCQEAVWDSPGLTTKDESNNKKQSKRLVVAEHEHDGNELQVTQGFKTYVAKKLGRLLDSVISEKQSSAPPNVNTEKHEDDKDEGFRLFSTSVPGQKTEESPPPKRRPIPSSSDSDSEMEARLKEAAVSIKDLLPSSTALLSNNSAETPDSETKEKVAKKKKKKKKKRKPNEEENDDKNSKSSNDVKKNNNNQEEAPTTVKLKKKKNKTTSKKSEGEVLN